VSSDFTNPSSRSAERMAAYVQAVLGLLEDRDPLDVLAETPEALEAAIDGRPEAELRRPEAPGKWSAVQVLQHLADAELVWCFRLRMALTKDRVRLEGYDQDLWAERFAYRDRDPRLALEQFTLCRALNLPLARTASPADLRRVAVHAERGEETVQHMIRLNAGHDLVHRRQIARILAS